MSYGRVPVRAHKRRRPLVARSERFDFNAYATAALARALEPACDEADDPGRRLAEAVGRSQVEAPGSLAVSLAAWARASGQSSAAVDELVAAMGLRP